MGREEEQAHHELREAEPRAAVLLRQEYHQESDQSEVRVPFRVRPGVSAGPHLQRAPESTEHGKRTRHGHYYREEAQRYQGKTGNPRAVGIK